MISLTGSATLAADIPLGYASRGAKRYVFASKMLHSCPRGVYVQSATLRVRNGRSAHRHIGTWQPTQQVLFRYFRSENNRRDNLLSFTSRVKLVIIWCAWWFARGSAGRRYGDMAPPQFACCLTSNTRAGDSSLPLGQDGKIAGRFHLAGQCVVFLDGQPHRPKLDPLPATHYGDNSK